LKKLGPLF